MNNKNILFFNRSIIKGYDPFFTSHSLDEVYMDLTAAAISRVENPNKNFDSTSSISSSSAVTHDDIGTYAFRYIYECIFIYVMYEFNFIVPLLQCYSS